MTVRLLLGTYTQGSTSKGIYALDLDLHTGMSSTPQLEIVQNNPSYITLSANKQCLYAVEEVSTGGMVYSYFCNNGTWQRTGSADSGGIGPCHVMLDEKHNVLAVANYMDGTVSFYSLGTDGALLAEKQTILLTGQGTDSVRQEGPHAHQCVCYGNQVLVCDLGTDKVRTFRRDTKNQFQEGKPLLQTCSGAGPRHLVMTSDQKMLYLICELSNTLYVFAKEGNNFVKKQMISYLPPDTPVSLAGAIRLSQDETYLFISSRGGYNGIAMFTLEPEIRMPSFCGLFPTADFPRDLMPVGNYLICACQQGNAVQIFMLDRTTQALVLQHEIALERPVCIAL